MTEVWPILQTVSPDGKAGDYDCLDFGQGEKRRGTGPDRERERAVQLGSKGKAASEATRGQPRAAKATRSRATRAAKARKAKAKACKGQSGHQR